MFTEVYSQKPAYKAPGVLEGLQLANHANSASPDAATLSNTTAGYATLGGRWKFAAVAGAETDYALFAYVVPATHRLLVSRIGISSMNTGAAVATTATLLDWSAGINSTAVSLATADSAPAYGPRRVGLGVQGFASGDAIGKAANDLVRRFKNPLIIEPSRYFHIILQMPVGTATSNQIIRGDICIDGRFEAIAGSGF